MGKYKNKKRHNTMALMVVGVVLLLVIAGAAVWLLQQNHGEEASTSLPASQERQLSGTVFDGTMNTIAVEDGNGQVYYFDTQDVPLTTGSTGIGIGNPVTVYYRGTLNAGQGMQPVEILRIEVQDASQISPTPEPAVPTLEEQAQEILDGMTLEEKVGQMFLVRCPDSNAVAQVSQYHLGGYILFGRDFENSTPEQITQTIASYQANAQIPLFIGVDEEGGTVNRVSRYSQYRSRPFASPQQLFAQGGLSAIQQDTVEKCQFLSQYGINMNFAPVCDVTTDSNAFMYSRAFGQDWEHTAAYVSTVVRAMEEQGMCSVLKHFPGYGSNGDTHTSMVTDNRSLESFERSDFLPFRSGIQAGGDVVLVSHNIVIAMDPDRPASLSPKVHRILREELGFDGVVITDDLYMEGVRQYAADDQVAVQAVLAGNDLLCCTDFEVQYPAVLEAAQSGVISQEQIDRSVLRILLLKLEKGILAPES